MTDVGGCGSDVGGCGSDEGRGTVERVYVIPAKAGIWRDGGDAYSLAIRANESNGTPRRKELD